MNVINIHASCVVLSRAGASFGAPEDAGVLLTGESGCGKSDVALRLIAMGAILVADDRCDIHFDGSVLLACAPRNIEGLIEIRGVGIATLPFAPEARIVLVVRARPAQESERLPVQRRYQPPAALA